MACLDATVAFSGPCGADGAIGGSDDASFTRGCCLVSEASTIELYLASHTWTNYLSTSLSRLRERHC